ncbi:hypothetical protein VTK26DRAFT_9492 [Humicola hyalothermophila]
MGFVRSWYLVGEMEFQWSSCTSLLCNGSDRSLDEAQGGRSQTRPLRAQFPLKGLNQSESRTLERRNFFGRDEPLPSLSLGKSSLRQTPCPHALVFLDQESPCDEPGNRAPSLLQHISSLVLDLLGRLGSPSCPPRPSFFDHPIACEEGFPPSLFSSLLCKIHFSTLADSRAFRTTP